jgi:hypothetical protein
MAGDSAATGEDGSQIIYRDPKVWRSGRLVLGIAGTGRWWALLRYVAPWPEPPKAGLDRWVSMDLLPVVQKTLEAAGAMSELEQGSLLIGARGRLYLLAGELCFARPVERYGAIGSGAQPALGALYDSQRSRRGPRARLERALEAAERYTATVRRPWSWEDA